MKIRSYLAYGWAILAAPIILATFMGNDRLSEEFVRVTGLHVHPIYTGGEVAKTIDHGTYQTLLHRPVFDGLIGQRNAGFVQIQWQAKDANLPASIDEPIDFDADGTNDFRLRLNTATQDINAEIGDARVVSVDHAIVVPNGRIVRVNLRRTPR
jgi:hypothetical protein